MGFFKVFQLFLKIGSKDFSAILPKLRRQYGLETGKNRFFTENAHFWVNGHFPVKNRVFHGFHLFLIIDSKDFSDFLSNQYRLTTGENHMFRKNLNFSPGGQKGPKNHRKSDPENPRKKSENQFFYFLLKITEFAKKANFFVDHFGPF